MEKTEIEALKDLIKTLRAEKHKKDKARIQKPKEEEASEPEEK